MEIEYLKSALKSLKRIPNPQRANIISAINGLPVGDIKKLQGLSNSYRLRVGDYRVLFGFNGNIITIENILPRGEAYKR